MRSQHGQAGSASIAPTPLWSRTPGSPPPLPWRTPAEIAELIRSTIQIQLAKPAEVVREAATRSAHMIGALSYGWRRLESERRSGRKLAVRAVGRLELEGDVTPELAAATIESITVRGIFRASPAVKAALANRIR